MSLPSPQRMRLAGSVAGLLIFVVPLTLLYFSMKAELSSQGGSAPMSAPLPAGRVVRKEPGPAGGPLALEIAGRSGTDVELRFRNVSQEPLRVAVPAAAGTIVRFAPAGSSIPGPPGAFEPASCTVIELLPGDAYTRIYRSAAPGGVPVAAVYDSRLPGLPDGIWSGRAESPAAP